MGWPDSDADWLLPAQTVPILELGGLISKLLPIMKHVYFSQNAY